MYKYISMFRLVIGSVHLEHDTNGYIGNIYCMKMFALSRSISQQRSK